MPLSRKKRSRVERRLLHIRDAMNDSCASIGDLPRGLPLSRDNEITAIELTIRDVPDTSPGAGDRCPSRAILTSNNPSRARARAGVLLESAATGRLLAADVLGKRRKKARR